MAAINLPGLTPSIGDLEQMIPIKLSVLGTPIYDDITFPAGNYDTNEGDTIDFNEVSLEAFQMFITQSKNIISTEVSGRSGTVDEYVNEGDYIITINGKVTEFFNVMPYDQLENWRRLKDSPEPITIINKILNEILDVNYVLIRRFDVSTIPGFINEVNLSMELKSTVPFNIDEFIL